MNKFGLAVSIVISVIAGIGVFMIMPEPQHSMRIHWAAAIIANTFGWTALRVVMMFMAGGFVFALLRYLRKKAAE